MDTETTEKMRPLRVAFACGSVLNALKAIADHLDAERDGDSWTADVIRDEIEKAKRELELACTPP